MNIVIYGKQNCVQCSMAKTYLDSRNIPYEYKQLDVDFVREDIERIAPTARSYPVIFVNGRNIGGFGSLNTALMVEGSMSPTPQLLTE